MEFNTRPTPVDLESAPSRNPHSGLKLIRTVSNSFGCGAWVTNSVHADVKHSHERPRLIAVLTGTLDENLGSSTRRGVGGDVFVREAGEVHATTYCEPETSYFSFEISKDIQAHASTPDTEGHAIWIKRLRHALHNAHDANWGHGLIREALFMLGWTLVEAVSEPAWLQGVDELIRAKCDYVWTLPMLAAEVGVHPVHLSRTYQRFRGISVSKALRLKRLVAACGQIEASHHQEIGLAAANSGFYDHSHLCRVLKRETGLNPTSYLGSKRLRIS